MKALLPAVVLCGALTTATAAKAPAADRGDATSGCLECHRGIEPIRQPGSKMMEAILEAGESRGQPGHCPMHVRRLHRA